MATHDYVIANASGSSVRSDLNNALAAIVSINSSSSEPSVKYSYMLWADSTNGILKIRNSSNNGWVSLFKLDGTDLANICRLTGSTNNTICTVTGANAIQGEATLTFDGANLGITAANDTAKLTFLRTGTTIGGSINTRDESSDKGLTYIAKDGNSGVPNHVFQTDAGSGASEVFRIQSNGNASIGGIAPVPTDAAYNKALLHIHQTQSGTYGSELHLTNNTTGSAAGDGMFLSMWTDNDVYFTNQEDGDINFTTNGHQALQIQSNKNVKITDGNLIIDTAGHGIDFSATSDAGGATNELLDNYEEGTWGNLNGSAVGAATIAFNRYTRIGNQVTVKAYIHTMSTFSSGQTFQLGGLPYTVQDDAVGSCMMTSVNWNQSDSSYVVSYVWNANLMRLYVVTDNAGWSTLQGQHLSTSSAIFLTLTYMTAA